MVIMQSFIKKGSTLSAAFFHYGFNIKVSWLVPMIHLLCNSSLQHTRVKTLIRPKNLTGVRVSDCIRSLHISQISLKDSKTTIDDYPRSDDRHSNVCALEKSKLQGSKQH